MKRPWEGRRETASEPHMDTRAPPSQKPKIGVGTAHWGGGGRLGATQSLKSAALREGEFPDDSIRGRTKSLMISPISKQRGLDSLLTQLG